MIPRVPSRWTEGLFYALTAFAPFAFGGVEPWSRAVLETLAFLLALACFLRGRVVLSPAAAGAWIIPAAFAAAGILQLRTVVAPDGPRPWAPFTVAPHATAGAVRLWAAYAAILWSVPRIFTTHEAARRYVRFLFGLGVALAALGLCQAAAGTGKIYWLRDARGIEFFGPFYDRDDAANALLMCLAAGLGLFFSGFRRGQAVALGPASDSFRSRGLIAGGVLLIFAAVVASGSRGALLALALSAAALAVVGADFAKRASSRRLRVAAALAAGAAVVYFAFRYVGAGADAGGLVDRSVTGRFFIYRDAWRWWRDSPFFGTGLGSFETVYPSYQDFELRAIVAHAHSDWLEILLETGVAGAAAAVAAAAATLFAAARTWRAARSTEMRALIGGALAAAVAFSIQALFEFCFQIPANAVLFLGIVGFLVSAPAWADKAADLRRPSPPSAWASVLATACFLILARAAARPTGAWGPDPDDLNRSASIFAQAVDADGRTPLKALRASLSYSLAATALRPFDSDSLFLAGENLARLGRPGDARVLIDEARSVRFPPIGRVAPNPLDEVEATRRKLETLRSLGILPRAPEKK